MKKERGFVIAKLIFMGGDFSPPTPGTQASKNIPVSIGLSEFKSCENQCKSVQVSNSRLYRLKVLSVLFLSNLLKGSCIISELDWLRNNPLGRQGRHGRHTFSSI